MSTVLPPAAALPLLVALPLPLPLLLLLLLQPAAAKAIAARAAMAVVRLMIFLSFFEVVRLPQSALTGLVCACGLAQPGVADLTKSLTAAGPSKGRFRPGSRAGRMSLEAPRSAISPLARSRPVRRWSAALQPDLSALTR